MKALINMAGSDLELGHRLQKLGLSKVRVPEAIGYHYKDRLTVASVPKHRQREKERGRMAVVFYERDPSFATRIQIEMSPIMFGLDRLLSLGNWPDAKGTERLLEYLESRGWELPLRVIVRLITHHDYMEGMREALRERKVRQGLTLESCLGMIRATWKKLLNQWINNQRELRGVGEIETGGLG